MRRRRLLAATCGTLSVAVAGCLGRDGGAGPAPPAGSESPVNPTDVGDWPSGTYADYETTTVTLWRGDGTFLGSVYAAVAASQSERYLGLSDAESLPPDAAMIFVYGSVSNRTFVMRDMDFGIDIIMADSDGQLAEIHHADAPGPDEDGENQRYSGRGQYVLETNYRWTTDHDVSVGDYLAFER